MNSTCQPTESTSKPETAGPMAGAKPINRPIRPMATPRFSRGNSRMITVNTMGMTTPVPAACRMRPAMTTTKSGPQAASALPAANSAKLVINSLRVENRPIKYADSGMMMASTNE